MESKRQIGDISVFLPTGAADEAAKPLAKRLKTVRGARIGVLDNCKEFADLVLRGVADVLKRDHAVGEIRFWRKPYLGQPSAFAAEMARECDAVINGVGH